MHSLILKPLLLLATVTLINSCKPEKTTTTYTEAEIAAESKKINDFFQKTFDARVALSPEFQTRLGIKKDYGKLDDISPEAKAKELEMDKEHLQWMTDSVNVAALSKEALLSYKL